LSCCSPLLVDDRDPGVIATHPAGAEEAPEDVVILCTGKASAGPEHFVEPSDRVQRLPAGGEVGALPELGGVVPVAKKLGHVGPAHGQRRTGPAIGSDHPGEEPGGRFLTEDGFDCVGPSGFGPTVIVGKGNDGRRRHTHPAVASAGRPWLVAAYDAHPGEATGDAFDRVVRRRRVDDDRLVPRPPHALDGGERPLEQPGTILRANDDGQRRR